jgi:hypothetical protein
MKDVDLAAIKSNFVAIIIVHKNHTVLYNLLKHLVVDYFLKLQW